MLPTKFLFIWPSGFSEEKIQMWKANWRWMPSDDKSSQGPRPYAGSKKIKYITLTIGYVGNMIYMYVQWNLSKTEPWINQNPLYIKH